jgi:hypothetical protein
VTTLPEEAAKTEKVEGIVLSPLVVGLGAAVIAAMAGMIYTLVKTIRSSPCYGHADGEPPLVEVAKESAKLNDQGSDEAAQTLYVEHDGGTKANGKTAKRRIGPPLEDPTVG